MKLYNNKFINIINSDLPNIEKKGNIAKVTKLEPTIEEYNEVIKVIKKFIEDKKRIVYGGKCWEALLQNKDSELFFYDKYDMSDYEFYSFEPIKDLKDLCDILHEKGFKYVEGANAQHDETFKIRVNYYEYCDISYIPKIIYAKMPKIKIDNSYYANFNFIIIDILRIFNDPLSSYWRIEKNGRRAFELFKHYSLVLKYNFTKQNYDDNILDYIRKELIIGSKLIVVGYYAYNYYKYLALDKSEELYVPYYDVISTNFVNDIDNIYQKLSKKFPEIKKEEYHPFYQFTGRKISFVYKDKQILNIYNNNDKCIPYKFLEKKNINIGSYNIVLMYLLINSLYYIIYENKEKDNIDFLIKNLIEYRNDYLSKNNNTPLDDTPFQEFFIQCLGDTYNTQIRFFKSMDKRNTKYFQKNRIGRYHPGITKDFDPTKFNFQNTAGRIKS